MMLGMLVLLLVAVAVGLSAGRCRFGWHGTTMSESVYDANGKRAPFVMQWRCRRCHRVLATQTEARPSAALMLDIHRQRRAARVLPWQKRA